MFITAEYDKEQMSKERVKVRQKRKQKGKG